MVKYAYFISIIWSNEGVLPLLTFMSNMIITQRAIAQLCIAKGMTWKTGGASSNWFSKPTLWWARYKMRNDNKTPEFNYWKKRWARAHIRLSSWGPLTRYQYIFQACFNNTFYQTIFFGSYVSVLMVCCLICRIYGPTTALFISVRPFSVCFALMGLEKNKLPVLDDVWQDFPLEPDCCDRVFCVFCYSC